MQTSSLSSGDAALVAGFNWAKQQALAYVGDAARDPVGAWYEAALPGREAFCMRDVAHQSTGAQVIGLAHATRNMLTKFAMHIAAARDWCTYWEIDRYDRPCPVDYRNDQAFWYNLPANFDVLHCCYRQYLWTGDRTYLDDPIFRNFYARTVDDYVRAWDRDGDGIPDHLPSDGYRGIGTYNEQVPHPCIGGDLLATQFAAYQTYADMLTLRGEAQQAAVFRERAQALQTRYERDWWNEATQRFASFQQQDGAYHFGCNGTPVFFPLALGLVQDRRKAQAALGSEIAQRTTLNVEERSYLPELFYNFGQADVAYAELLTQMHPTYARREYPEVSFAALGSIVTGMMGIAPDARTQTIATCPRLTTETPWVTVSNLPVFANHIQVTHKGCMETALSHLRGEPFRWQAKFSGEHAALWVDGVKQDAICRMNVYGQTESWVLVTLEPGATKQVQIRYEP
ncbi:MAG: hypothetical protein U0350_39475 [Caldilineaceae bacterium]